MLPYTINNLILCYPCAMARMNKNLRENVEERILRYYEEKYFKCSECRLEFNPMKTKDGIIWLPAYINPVRPANYNQDNMEPN